MAPPPQNAALTGLLRALCNKPPARRHACRPELYHDRYHRRSADRPCDAVKERAPVTIIRDMPMRFRFAFLCALACLTALAPAARAADPGSPCANPTQVILTLHAAPVRLNAGECVLFHAPWVAANASERDQMIASTTASMLLDSRPVPFTWVMREDGLPVADAVWLSPNLPAGQHTLAFILHFTRRMPDSLNLYTAVPTGSLFAAGVRLDVGGPPVLSDGATPCPPTAAPAGWTVGLPDGSGCASWGLDGAGRPQGLGVSFPVSDALNPHLPMSAPPPPPVARGAAAGPVARMACGRRHRGRHRCRRGGRPVTATLIAFNGDHVYIKRADGQIIKAATGANMYPGDQIVTGPNSLAVAEFTIGGKIGVPSGTIVTVTGDRQGVGEPSGLQPSDENFLQRLVPHKPPLIIRGPACTLGIRG